MRPTSIGVEYLEMRELGFSSPMSTSSLQRLYTLGENSRKAPTTSPWSGVRAMALAHGPDSSCGPTALLFSKSTPGKRRACACGRAGLEVPVP